MLTRVDQIQLASGLNAAVGVWLIASPWALGYAMQERESATTSAVVVGLGVAVFGLIRAYGAYRAAWRSVVNVLAGAWLAIAPWMLGYESDAARWNSVLVGVIVVALGVWSAAATLAPPGTRSDGSVGAVRERTPRRGN